MVGFSAATVYKRFGTFALTATLLALGLLLVLAGWLVTRANAWAALGDWISTQGYHQPKNNNKSYRLTKCT